MYMPPILDARHASSYQIGPYLAMVFTDCQSEGPIRYSHVMFVYQIDPAQPEKPGQRLMAVAAEVNDSALYTGIPGPSHFLGVFPGEGHINMGASDQWADLEAFTQKALEVAAEHLDVAEPPRLLRKKRWPG
jgi:hypothetical protein